MRVRIVTYDQVKGKGTCQPEGGPLVPFSYKQFRDEVMIPPGEYAESLNGILHPTTLTKWEKIKEVIKSWLS